MDMLCIKSKISGVLVFAVAGLSIAACNVTSSSGIYSCRTDYALCEGGLNLCCPAGAPCCNISAKNEDYAFCCRRGAVCCDGGFCCGRTSHCCPDSGCCINGYKCCLGSDDCCPDGTECCGNICCKSGLTCVHNSRCLKIDIGVTPIGAIGGGVVGIVVVVVCLVFGIRRCYRKDKQQDSSPIHCSSSNN